ncbi:MAG: sulfatase [Myxococcales bacterium]|nr:sulfatase [Myxococcales bacterium]
MMLDPIIPSARRTWFNPVLPAVLSVVFAIACDRAIEPTRPSPPTHVLLVVIDSLRADHLKSYGYARDTSPSLDRLAREGARFETALAPTSWALPSLVTLLTALPPEQHGVIRADLALSDDALTLTEVLKKNGFATAAIVAGANSDPDRGLSQGFDRYTYVAGGEVGSEVVAWMTEWDRGGRVDPFFLFVKIPLIANDEVLPASFAAMFRPNHLEVADVERALDLYDREIRFADSQLDLMLQKLEGLELAHETVVIVTSSHGEEFLERGNTGHGNTLHGESVRVPLIVRFPRLVDAGKIIVQPARLMDIGSTIMMLARIREPDEFGFHHDTIGIATRDLTEFLVGEWNGKDVLVCGDLAGKSQSIRLGSYKLIHRGEDEIQLFNLELDPDEKHDLSKTESQRARVYLNKLERWREICAERPQYARAHRATGD